jgi:hypothetical protein
MAVLSINEDDISSGSQNLKPIYKCIIQLLFGLTWEMLSFLLFSTEKIYSNLFGFFVFVSNFDIESHYVSQTSLELCVI